MRWSGLHLQKRLPCSLLGKIRPKSMARGNGLESRDERLVVSPQRPSPMPRERDAALPGRGKPQLRAKCVKRTLLRERAVYLAYQTDCLRCALREQCLDPGAKGNLARRESRVRRLLPPPASVERGPVRLGPMRWVDVAGRALRRTWSTRLPRATRRGASAWLDPAKSFSSIASSSCGAFPSELSLA